MSGDIIANCQVILGRGAGRVLEHGSHVWHSYTVK